MSSPALVIILATDAFRSLISEFLYPHFPNIDTAIPRTSYLAHWLALSNIRRVLLLDSKGKFGTKREIYASGRRGINSVEKKDDANGR